MNVPTVKGGGCSTMDVEQTCSECGAKPKAVRFRADGVPALPMKWQRAEDGSLLCSDCRHDDPTVNWTFGADAPIDGMALVREQFRLAHNLRNKLCEIERERRCRTDAALRFHCPELADLEPLIAAQVAAVDGLVAAIKGRNAQSRRRTATEEDRATIAAARCTLRGLRARRKELRLQAFADGERGRVLGPVEEWAAAAARTAYSDCTLYWGTKGIVLKAARDMRTGAPPKFAAWPGGRRIADDDATVDAPVPGHLAVQLQGGQSIADTLECSTLFRLEMTAAKHRGGLVAIAWFRVGSTADGKPMWARVPVCVHRMPPAAARIKWAHLICEVTGSIEKWKLMIAVQWLEAHDRPDAATEGTVGINLGWRAMPDGSIRVASWVGSDGRKGEVHLPAHQISALDYLDSLRGIQDKLFDDARNRLSAWLAGHPHPEWLAAGTVALPMWKSGRRLCRVVEYWRDHRFEGDAEIFDWMNAVQVKRPDGRWHYVGFRRQWKHLHDEEMGRRKRLAAQRRELYRNFAATLSREYRTVCLDTANYARMAQRPQVGEEDGQSRHLRRMARLAAVGLLRLIIRSRMAAETSVEAAYITQRCSACGEHQGFDASGNLVNCCRHCGSTMDQDENAARNALALGGAAGSKGIAARGPEADGGERLAANGENE